ncbi:MAG: tRNA (adenosine(37)-N6)-threonylcarbamoyltransferase complex ATPase subunit type 1 TsaE [Pseudomonadales bacterium]|nr:tRNA (adenosine(37)-N6)-threonylcarbamoyltransferase complex ATPase subunit type 1 TsaE [Pseudomonadales bacterium]
MAEHRVFLANEAATAAFGKRLGELGGYRGLISLSGDPGAGKTTLCRGLIRGAGHCGSVRSPTYTLVEAYELGPIRINHLDLYRLSDPEELDYLGFRDYLDGNSLCLVEWPEQGGRFLPAADLKLSLRIRGSGRDLSWVAGTPRGQALSAALAHDYPSSLTQI